MNFETSIGFALLASASVGSAALSIGTIVNIDYHNGNGTGTGAAVIGAAGDTWNLGSNGSTNGLVDNGGAATGINNFMASSVGGSQNSFQFGSDAVAQDYIYLRDDNTTTIALPNGTYAGVGRRMTIYDSGASTDLDSSQTWNLHMIGAGDNGAQGANFLLKQPDGAGGFTWLTASNSGNPAFSGAYTQGVNYSTFSNVVPTTWGAGNHEFEIYFYWTDPDTTIAEDLPANPGTFIQTTNPGGGNAFGALNGIQMELVPEPSTALLGVIGLAFGLRRRR